MAAEWEEGELVLSLELLQAPRSSFRVVLKPLGLSVAGTGCGIKVPGEGVIDLRMIPAESQQARFGVVEVTGEQARALLSRLSSEAPDLDERLHAGGRAIVVMNAGTEAAHAMESGWYASGDQALLGDAIRTVLNAGKEGADGPGRGRGTDEVFTAAPGAGGADWNGGKAWVPVMRVAMCRQHRLPEICPRQH